MEMINSTVYLECRGKIIPIRVCEEFPRCLCPSSSTSDGKDFSHIQSRDKEEVDQLSGNGGFRRCVHQATSAREEEMGGGSDGVSRVLGIGLVRSEELGRGNDGKHAPAGVAIQGCMGNGIIDACPKEDGPFQAVNLQKTMMNEIQTLNRDVGSSGLLKELSSTEGERPNLNLEVLLEGVQVGLER
ncbi:hypothetical protein CsSME_00012158 [Camellia sinensis var. sinensis]